MLPYRWNDPSGHTSAFLSTCFRFLTSTQPNLKWHNHDVIMTTMASQITSLTVVYSTVHLGAYQRKHQSSASLAFVRGIHRDRWIPRTKGQLRRKCYHLMTSSWQSCLPASTKCIWLKCSSTPGKHRPHLISIQWLFPDYHLVKKHCRTTPDIRIATNNEWYKVLESKLIVVPRCVFISVLYITAIEICSNVHGNTIPSKDEVLPALLRGCAWNSDKPPLLVILDDKE